MNWDAIGAIGEILGSFAVLLTLVYLAVQLRQTYAAIKVSSANTIANTTGQVWIEMITNEDFVDLILKGNGGLANLSANERTRFVMYNSVTMRFFENQFSAMEQGALSAAVWEGQKRAIQQALETSGVQEAWAINREFLSEDFVAMVDSLPARAEPTMQAEEL